MALILLAGVIVWALRGAFDAFIESSSFAAPMTWALGMTWAFDLAWSVVFGAVMGALVRSRQAMIWAAGAGALYGAANFAMTEHRLAPGIGWGIRAGIYGQYAVACIGALVGAWIGTAVLRGRPRVAMTAPDASAG